MRRMQHHKLIAPDTKVPVTEQGYALTAVGRPAFIGIDDDEIVSLTMHFDKICHFFFTISLLCAESFPDSQKNHYIYRMLDPLQQFKIHPLIPLHVAGYDVTFTNSSLAMLIATILILLLGIWGTSAQKNFTPSTRQMAIESALNFVINLAEETLGSTRSRRFLPLIMTLFWFLFMGNVLGLLPGNFTFTSHIIVTFVLAIFVFILATSLGIAKNGLAFFQRFYPHGVPLLMAPLIIPVEILSYIFRPFSLAVRLFANMLAGHILLKIFAIFCVLLGVAGVFPMLFNAVFFAFELFVAGLQAYIFTILTCVYIQDALDIH